MRTLVIVALVALAACSSGPPRPVNIDSSDMCSRCRMAISEQRYAAERVDGDGNTLKFDDIGCLVRYVLDHHLDPKTGTYFVTDYQARRWLPAAQATYVHSSAIPTPMLGGLAAFEDKRRAQQFAATVHGQVMAFEELWTAKL